MIYWETQCVVAKNGACIYGEQLGDSVVKECMMEKWKTRILNKLSSPLQNPAQELCCSRGITKPGSGSKPSG